MVQPSIRRKQSREQFSGGTGFSFQAIPAIWLALIVYLFTPYTYSLDEIKISVLYFGGPLLLCLYLYLAAIGKARAIPWRLFWPGLAYTILLVPSTLITKPAYRWVGWHVTGFQFACLGGFLICYGLMKSREDVKRAFLFYALVGLGTTIFGLFHYAGGFGFLYELLITDQNRSSPFAVMLYTYMDSRDDMFSTILNRQFYASFLVMLIPLSAAVAITEEKSHRKKYIAIAATLLMVICLYLAHSKAAAGSLVLSAALFLILYKLIGRYKKIRIPHLGVWLSGLLLIALTLGFFTADVSADKFKTVTRSVESRTIIWKGALDMFRYGPGPDNWYEITERLPYNAQSLIMGCGPGTFRLVFPRYRSPDYHLHDISNVTLFAHNRYLDLLAENGLAGFLLYMGFIALYFVLGIRRIRRCEDGEMRVYLIAFLSSMLGILLTNLLTPNSRWTVVASNFWAVWGLGFGAMAVAGDMAAARASAPESGAGPVRPAPASALPMPSPRESTALMIVMVLLLPVAVISIHYSWRHFKAAAIHNDGLMFARYGDKYLEDAQKMLQLARENPGLADQYRKQKDAFEAASLKYYQDSIRQHNISLRYNPWFITTYYKMAHAQNMIGDIEGALKTYEVLQKYAPDYSEIHFNLGVVNDTLAQTKRREAAAAAPEKRAGLLEEAAAHDVASLREFQISARMSNKAAVQETYGKKLVMAQKYREALPVFEFLRESDMDKMPHIQTIAWLSDQLGEEEKAFEAYKALFHADPTNDFVSSRVEMYYRKLRTIAEYEQFLREFLRANPLDPKPRIRLVELHVRKDDKDALRSELKAMTHIPEIADRLGVSPEQAQKSLWGLTLSARRIEDPGIERYFLKQCLQADAATSIGRAAQARLRELGQ